MTPTERQLLDDGLGLLEEMNERLAAVEAKVRDLPPPGWASGCEYLINLYITRKNAMVIAGTLATIYFTYFVGAAVGAPGT